MYSITIPLTDLMLKVGREAYLYHQVTAYNHITAYARLAFVVIDLKAMINYPADRKLRHAKRFFNMSTFYHVVGSSAIPQAC